MAGFLDFLNPQSQGLGAQPQQGLGFMGRASSFREQNPGALATLGAHIMDRNLSGGFAAAAPIIAQGKKRNQTAQFLLTKGFAKTPEEAMTLASEPQLLSLILKNPDQYTERAEAATRYGLKPDDPKYRDFVLGMDAGGGSEETWSITPTLGKDPKTGKTVLGVGSNHGGWRTVETGEGFEPYSPYDKRFEGSAGGAAGKAEGEAIADYRSMTAKMPGVEAVVNQLDALADKATYTAGGQLIDSAMRQSGMEPREAAVARAEYIAMVDNQVLPLLRDTFGAQFTVQEGESLRATLGNPDKSPKEKKAILNAFIEQKRRNIEALATQTGQTIPAPPGGGGGGEDPLGIR